MRTQRRRSIFACFLLLILLACSGPAFCAAEDGQWTLSQSDTPDHLQFSLQSSHGEDHHFSSNSDWSLSEFHGLDWSTPAKHDVHFTIARDAGSFDCQGFVQNGAGAGLFAFRATPQYSEQMAALGVPGVSDYRQFSFAVHDITLAFARGIKDAGVTGLDADKLIAFRIHGVSPEFIKSLKTVGIDTADANKLIAFRIHGVSPDFVNELVRLGYPHPDADKLIALRIHGVTPEYIQTLRSRGVQNLTLDQLIALRIHGIE